MSTADLQGMARTFERIRVENPVLYRRLIRPDGSEDLLLDDLRKRPAFCSTFPY